MRRRDLTNWDARLSLKPGSKVLLRQYTPGKTLPKCSGPHTFLRTIGRKSHGGELMTAQGKVIRVALANLLPFRGQPLSTAANRGGAVPGDWDVHDNPVGAAEGLESGDDWSVYDEDWD